MTIDEQPQRAGTWASNLRSTLFAAIAGNRGPTPLPEDRFTRQVLPLHRNSSRREEYEKYDHAFPIVEEEKDVSPITAEAIGSVFLAPSLSTDSSNTNTLPARPKRLPLRGSAGDRYKAYARSTRSVDEESCASWSSGERMPSRLAGGQPARGVRG